MTRAPVWTEPFRIRAYEAGPDERASLLAVCNLFQEAAGEQARAFGVDRFETPGDTAVWVLHRLRVEAAGPLPRMHDAVTVETWPSAREGLRAHRDFVLRDESGRAVVRATSVWFLIGLARRRPVRLPAAMDDFAPADAPRALTLDGCAEPEPVAAPDTETRFSVRHADLDRVGHANHVRVLEWILEAAPAGVRVGHSLAALDVVFRAEATVGETALSVCQASAASGGTALAHAVRREADGNTLALARTFWTLPAAP